MIVLFYVKLEFTLVSVVFLKLLCRYTLFSNMKHFAFLGSIESNGFHFIVKMFHCENVNMHCSYSTVIFHFSFLIFLSNNTFSSFILEHISILILSTFFSIKYNSLLLILHVHVLCSL